jgi:hypothetical protein
LLEALAERMQEEMEQRVLPIAQDFRLPALATILRREINRETTTLLIALLSIWSTDDNALIRQKVDAARVKRLAPLLTGIVRQGLQCALASRYAAFEMDGDEQQYIRASVAAYNAYMDAIERLLGGSSPVLYRIDTSVINEALAINKRMTSISKGD